jgi:hypothetical protein
MFKRIIAAIILAFFAIYLHGCYSNYVIPRDELLKYPDYTIAKIVTDKEEIIEFEINAGGASITNNEVAGYVKEGSYRSIPLSQVKMIYVRKFNPVNTAFAVIGVSALVVAVTGLIIAATKESCPFVYSFDGEKYVFDGEPYGGATCAALQRTDLCKLEYLQPVGNEYRLRLTNEVDETQYTDEFKLLVVDHPSGVEVIPDANGILYTVNNPQRPLEARDTHGRDLYHWVSEKDLLFWESDLLAEDPDNPSALRDTIVLTFPKPASVQKTKLVVNISNTLWASQMLKRVTELRGEQVGQWYEELKTPARYEQSKAWHQQEEVFRLQVRVWANNAWVNRGEIIGGGPFVTEERIVPLDLEGIKGDSLRILLAPPIGFWQINSIGIDYSQDVPLKIQEISAKSVVADDGTDLLAILRSTDGDYYTMPELEQYANLTFKVPPRGSELKRTIFAKVSGYYDMHLNASGSPQSEILNKISYEPGYIVKFTLQEYYKWRKEQLAKTEK